MATRESLVDKKPEWHLMPFDALEEVVKVLMDGKYRPRASNNNQPYGANNWRTPPYFKEEDIYNSLQRHIKARFFDGEEMDQDSGGALYHTAHIACNALFALYYDMFNLWREGDLVEARTDPEESSEEESSENSMDNIGYADVLADGQVSETKIETFSGIERNSVPEWYDIKKKAQDLAPGGISIDTLARLRQRFASQTGEEA